MGTIENIAPGEAVPTPLASDAGDAETKSISSRLLNIMAIAAGLGIANIYYNQPLLADMARTFQVSAERIGWVAMLTQGGFASGMLLVSPLGDAMDRRKMVVTMCLVAAFGLLLAGVSPSVLVLAVASYIIGLGSIIPQLLVPFAVYLSRRQEQGRAVGTVMSGLLIGILLARTFSGYIGHQLGWRFMFLLASALMVCVGGILRLLLPSTERRPHLSYGQLMSSLATLFMGQPVARESIIVGSTMFASFAVFWSTLAFRLETPPYHYSSQMAGLFGLVGVVGALAARVAGYWADHHEPRTLLRIYSACGVLAFVCFWAFGHSIWGLIVGVILLDAGVQGGSTCNQTRNYRAVPWAQNRVNTIYMTIFFVGGSIGTTIGTYAWQHYGYTGVCIAGIVLVCIAGVKVLLPLKAGAAAGEKAPIAAG